MGGRRKRAGGRTDKMRLLVGRGAQAATEAKWVGFIFLIIMCAVECCSRIRSNTVHRGVGMGRLFFRARQRGLGLRCKTLDKCKFIVESFLTFSRALLSTRPAMRTISSQSRGLGDGSCRSGRN